MHFFKSQATLSYAKSEIGIPHANFLCKFLKQIWILAFRLRISCVKFLIFPPSLHPPPTLRPVFPIQVCYFCPPLIWASAPMSRRDTIPPADFLNQFLIFLSVTWICHRFLIFLDCDFACEVSYLRNFLTWKVPVPR